MLPKEIFKYVLDIESIIDEIEKVKEMYPSFVEFDGDFLAKRAVERHLEIIGEAVNNIRKNVRILRLVL